MTLPQTIFQDIKKSFEYLHWDITRLKKPFSLQGCANMMDVIHSNGHHLHCRITQIVKIVENTLQLGLAPARYWPCTGPALAPAPARHRHGTGTAPARHGTGTAPVQYWYTQTKIHTYTQLRKWLLFYKMATIQYNTTIQYNNTKVLSRRLRFASWRSLKNSNFSQSMDK